ncbi:1-acyl-sn-glycerol-3-phosphate acyltransferase [Azoarcus sp. L1K30]|nr:1-acyl-sn-glycerol-3-phosphate acyltransferase [Azoarcus sp. L1K30]
MPPGRAVRASGVRPFPVVYAYFCLYFGLLVLGLMCLVWSPFAVVLHPFMPDHRGRRLGRLVITRSFRTYLAILGALGACRFDIEALDALKDQGPMILAPNHPCLLDAVMVIARLPDVACIMKASLLKNVFLGSGARLARYIPNGRPLQMVYAACEALAAGSQLLMFPEGTRTVRAPVNAIMPSVALISRRAKVPVQTIIIETDSAYLSKGWPLFRRPPMPIHYRVRLGRRFDPPASATAFCAELEAYFADELAQARFVPPQFADTAAEDGAGSLSGARQ